MIVATKSMNAPNDANVAAGRSVSKTAMLFRNQPKPRESAVRMQIEARRAVRGNHDWRIWHFLWPEYVDSTIMLSRFI